jgi:hypothetical protein
MNCLWTLPGQPLDHAALERMRQNFQEPAEPMPEAWFMSGEINYWTGLVGVDPAGFEVSTLEHTLDEAASGIRCFPENPFVPLWKAWILYLLPHALVCEKEKDKFILLIPPIIGALITIYPDRIVEEYQGFRNDIIRAICARVLPQTLARDNPQPAREDIRIVNDIWDLSLFFSDEPLEFLSVSILFCLKYLQTNEIEEWATSVLGIESVQFHLEFMIWWLAFNEFLKRVREWPLDGRVSKLLKETNLTEWSLPLPAFASFDAFIPTVNLAAFESALAVQLSFATFQQWSRDIRSNAGYYLALIEPILQRFERMFFCRSDE